MGSCTFTIYWINKQSNNWFNEVNKQPKWHGKIILTKSSIFSPDIEAGSIRFPVVRNKICFFCAPAFCFMFLLVNKLLLSSATRLAFFALLRFVLCFLVVKFIIAIIIVVRHKICLLPNLFLLFLLFGPLCFPIFCHCFSSSLSVYLLSTDLFGFVT